MQKVSNAHATGAHRTVFVTELTNGVLDPAEPMLGPLADGGIIIANTAPGCWGPMITPAIRGGHEVTRPVGVEGADVGDAIAIRIRSLVVTSAATASGSDEAMAGRFNGDPFCAGICPGCGTKWPATRIEGIGPTAVRCVNCDADAAPFTISNGYTMAFDEARTVGVTIDRSEAEKMAHNAPGLMAIPDISVQNPILTFAAADLVAVATRLRPFLGQLGTTPSMTMPDSHNAGDFGSFLLGAPHEFVITEEQLLANKTDGHLDVNTVREGAVLICPVKVPGGGVYLGDMHAFQGDGEIAGHTADVAGTAILEVHVIKGLAIDGPILFPVIDDLPYLARPLSTDERHSANAIAAKHGIAEIEADAPVTFIGTGANLNKATDNGLERAADVLGLSVDEVRNRATIAGAIEIGRHPGVVRVTLRAPLKTLDRLGLGAIPRGLYGL